jgi:hypothetical protein
MAKPDDAHDADRAKHAKEELDQATRELDALDPAGQERVLELLSLDKPSLDLLLELLQKLKDGKNCSAPQVQPSFDIGRELVENIYARVDQNIGVR